MSVFQAPTAYGPPGHLPDFSAIPGQLDAWSAAVSGWFDEAIKRQRPALDGQPCQYFNQLTDPPKGAVVVQEIVWNGFPATLRRRWGRQQALRVADHPLPLDQRMDAPGEFRSGPQWAEHYYRAQDEYCEWRVKRDREGRIVRVTFTSEPPEYWQALHGDTLESDGPDPYEFRGDKNAVLALYREYVDESIELADLQCPVDMVDDGGVLYKAGEYNPYNRWNTTDGIMHLTHPSNTLRAEITLGADATVLWTREQRLVADADALIACARYGGNNRASDPTIGASINHLAARGFGISLANPVGLYMDHLDMTGWTRPGGEPVDPDWFQVVRGTPGLIERAVFEVTEPGLTVSDLLIGGEPIRFGGQLAERMTVKLVGIAAVEGGFTNRPARFGNRAWADADNPWMVRSTALDDEPPPNKVPVFDYPEALTSARAAGAPAPPPSPRRWTRA
jgi:hypothetical protein